MSEPLITRCCWCCTLTQGSFVVAFYIVITNILALAHMKDLADEDYNDKDDASAQRRRLLLRSIFGGAFISAVLLVIGIVILVGLFLDKYSLVKWAAVATVLSSCVRISTTIWMAVEGVFYFYGFIVLWSYVQEQEKASMVARVSDAEIRMMLEHLTSADRSNQNKESSSVISDAIQRHLSKARTLNKI